MEIMKSRRELTVRAEDAQFSAVIDFMEEAADLFGLDVQKKFGLLIVVEEAFVNICRHAYAGAAGEVELSCDPVEDSLVVEIRDYGEPFDLLSHPPPDIALSVSDREPGGLGIHFIRTLSDKAGYRREGGKNILRLVFRRGEDDV